MRKIQTRQGEKLSARKFKNIINDIFSILPKARSTLDSRVNCCDWRAPLFIFTVPTKNNSDLPYRHDSLGIHNSIGK